MIKIDLNAENPLFQQLIEQVKQAIKSGVVLPGDPLPSIRQLSADLELNPKTVSKAYKLLERDGVIQARGYRGTRVSENALSHCHFELAPLIKEELSRCINLLRQKGATDAELRNTFNQILNNQ